MRSTTFSDYSGDTILSGPSNIQQRSVFGLPGTSSDDSIAPNQQTSSSWRRHTSIQETLHVNGDSFRFPARRRHGRRHHTSRRVRGTPRRHKHRRSRVHARRSRSRSSSRSDSSFSSSTSVSSCGSIDGDFHKVHTPDNSFGGRIGDNVSSKVMKLICRNKFVELSQLVPSYGIKRSHSGIMIHLDGSKARYTRDTSTSPMNIHQWEEAFDCYIAAKLRAVPRHSSRDVIELATNLLTYKRHANLINKKRRGMDGLW